LLTKTSLQADTKEMGETMEHISRALGASQKVELAAYSTSYLDALGREA
jgi:hypothetical protein